MCVFLMCVYTIYLCISFRLFQKVKSKVEHKKIFREELLSFTVWFVKRLDWRRRFFIILLGNFEKMSVYGQILYSE